MDGCGTRFPRLIDRAFVRGASTRRRRAIRDHLGECTTCRARWDRLAIIDRRLGGPVLSAEAIEGIREAVISPTRVASLRRPVWAIAGGLAAAAALLVIVTRGRDPNTGLRPRGGEGSGRTPGVRLFCIDGDGNHVAAEARMVSTGHAPVLRCTIDADLQLAYTTPDLEGLTMIAFGRRDQTLLSYVPSDGGDAMPVRSNVVDETVDWSTKLAINHRTGTYEIVVRFFEGPVRTSDAIVGRVRPRVELRGRLEVISRGGSDAP